MTQAIAILKCPDIGPAVQFYISGLGFTESWRWNGGAEGQNPAYVSLSLAGAEIHLSSFPGDGVFGSAVYLRVRDLVDVEGRIKAHAPDRVEFGPADRPWGMRELYVRDPGNNQLRFSVEARAD